MAVVTLPLPLQRVAMQSVMARGLPSIVARSVSVAPKLQQQRWRSARRVVVQAAVRSVTSANSVVGPLGLANAGVWGRFVGLRAERVVVRKEEITRTKRTYRTVASAALLDERINQQEFTEMAWQAIEASPDVAKESKQQIVETEHLMKALLEQRNGLARRIFAKAGVDNTSLLQATERFVQRQPKVMGDTSGSMLGRDLEGLIDKARGHRKEYGDSFVSVEHLVLAYAQDKRFGQQLFKDFQLNANALNAAIQSVREPATLPEPGPQWDILERWNVPWDGTTTVAGILSWLGSFVLTGLIVSLATAQFGRRQDLDLDEQATFILFYQLAQTITGLGALSLVLGQYKPLPTELFSYEFRAPFDLRRGWILYGGLGLVGATASVLAASTLVVELSGQQPPRENADALLQLLPIIGASPASTASLVFVTGVLAPLLEETVFRGFVLTSLTKWVPTPVAVVVSACAFAGAHLTPGEFPQLLALGIVLGLAYAQTRTLATPILIHSLWNSGVIILLTILRLQGYDIKELL